MTGRESDRGLSTAPPAMRRVIGVFVAAALLAGVANAAPMGTAFTYQGQLKDAGLPANAAYDFQFKLFDAAAAGAQIGSTVLKGDVAVSGGLFSVSLDFGATPFAGQSRFLEIGVRPGASTGAYTLLGSRQELTPSPNALFATSAGTAAIATTSTSFSGALAGEVTGTQGATVVSNAVSLATPGAIVRRDGGGGFAAGSIALAGNLTLPSPSSSTSGNILKGGAPFLHNFGSNNTFLGLAAGNFTMSGISNTAAGFLALQANTSGADNTAIGANALASNTTGDSNAAVGVNALQNNASGDNNTASGHNALRANTFGVDNTANGREALLSNTIGTENTAVGRAALVGNTTGNRNTGVGKQTLTNVSTGSQNTALGFGANVAGGASNATAIGNGAFANASNKIRLGDSLVTVIEGQVAYTFPSDRTQKENFRDVDAHAVLEKLRSLDVTTWNYIGHDPKEFRHYGPMAQDFFAAFGRDELGVIGTETTINSGDITAILMLGLKGLDAQARQDQRTIAAQAALLEEQSARIALLERQAAEIAALKTELTNFLARSQQTGPRAPGRDRD